MKFQSIAWAALVITLTLLTHRASAAQFDPCVGPGNTTGDENICGACCAGNTTIGCFGAGMDCGGVCNGNGTVNATGCGSCVQPEGQSCNCSNIGNSCIQDCGGTLVCFAVCASSSLACELACGTLVIPDCNGDCAGGAFVNPCGFCVEGNTNVTSDFGFDCNGDCNGTAAIDDCGICAGGNTMEVPDADKDCAGTCFGNATTDPCGICNGNSTVGDCCNCPRSAGYWKTHNCFARSKTFRNNGASHRLRREWPGQYSDCDETICSTQWLDIMWTPSKGDAWNILARQYVAAQLNLENIPCFKNNAAETQVTQWIADAKQLLESNCGGIPKGHADRSDALALADSLEAFNSKTADTLLLSSCTDGNPDNNGPDNDDAEGLPGDAKRSAMPRRGGHMKNRQMVRAKRLDMETRIAVECFEASVIQQGVISNADNVPILEDEGILPGEPPLQCVGGSALDATYWCQHNSEQIHPQTDEEWGGGTPLELCTICGQSMYSLVTEHPELTNDTYLFVAKQWIAAVVNIQNGACLTQVAADALFDALELMESTCSLGKRDVYARGHNESHDFVPPSSDLGQALLELHDQLESFNVGEWGPYENLLDELNEQLSDDDDCTDERQRNYLIWAIVVSIVCGVVSIIAIVATCGYVMKNVPSVVSRMKVASSGYSIQQSPTRQGSGYARHAPHLRPRARGY